MTHFPHMMAFVLTTPKENSMLDFEEVNRILDEMAEQGIIEPMVEPIDDPSIQTDFYDWAEVVGISDEIEPDVEFRV
jgi:hypothetical protein